jgi:uncharacterized protein (DUF58 family)
MTPPPFLTLSVPAGSLRPTCRGSFSKPAVSPRRSSTACTAAAAPGRARTSGNIAASFPASRRDDFLYVREQEWEAAHTVWIWPDRSPSMAFSSRLAPCTKLDRTLVMGLALAEILVGGGERVGVPGLTRPSGARNVVEKISEAMIHDPAVRTSLPPAFAPSPQAEVIVLSDLWSPIAEVTRMIAQLSATGAQGHVIQIVDPAEETFPYAGRIEFVEPEGAGRVTTGRAESWREDYVTRVDLHRAAIRAETDRLGWSFIIHRTDRPATELLLKLHERLGAGREAAGINRWHAQTSERQA